MRGLPLNYNAAVQQRYSAKLRALTRKMSDDVAAQIVAYFKTEKASKFFATDAGITDQAKQLTDKLQAQYQQLFSDDAPRLANGMVDDSNNASNSALTRSLKELSGGLTINTDVFSEKLDEVTKAIITENVNLIKSIPTEFMADVHSAVMHSITTGNGLEDLIPFFKNHVKINDRRAKNIALDQTRKAFNGLNSGKMQKLGMDDYEWLHSGGSQHPRLEHIAMNGNIYSLKKPPVIDYKTGQVGKPGDAYNCKCRMRPIVKFDEGGL